MTSRFVISEEFSYSEMIDKFKKNTETNTENNSFLNVAISLIVTMFILSIRTPQILTILVLKFEPVQFTTQCCV